MNTLRPIPGFSNYAISRDGTVVVEPNRAHQSSYVVVRKDTDGRRVKLYKDGKKYNKYISTLLKEVFPDEE